MDQPSVKGLKIAVSFDLGFYEVDAEVIRNTGRHCRLRDAGAIVEESVLIGMMVWNGRLSHLVHIFATSIAPALEKSALMTDYARAFAEQSLDAKAEAFVKSLYMAGEVGVSFARAMAVSMRWFANHRQAYP